ncbi:MAG: discoidin domain-containing protein, partial [Victivallaceae bacterium]
DTRALYGELVRYLTGKPVRLAPGDQWSISREDGKIIYSTRLTPPAAAGLLEIAFDPAEPGRAWRGIIAAQLLIGEKWENAGWIYRGSPVAADGAFPMSAIRLDGREARALRLVFDGPGMPEVKSISRDYPLPPKLNTLSSGKSYRSNLPVVANTYPDRSGRQLLDGVNFSNGFREYVGWWGNGRTDVAFDFRDAAAAGQPLKFDEVRVHTRRDRKSAVDFPLDPLLFLARDGNWRGGGLPAGLRVIAPAAVEVERHNDETDFGVIRFAIDPPATENAMLFSSSRRQWLMLSEVEFLRNGKKLAADSVRYQLLTPPRRSERVPYADDGRLLTDGDGLDSWSAGKVAGVNDGRLIEVVIDLGKPTAVSRITAWSFGGGRNGIYAPRSGRVAFSDDGVKWSEPLKLTIPALEEDRRKLEAVPCRSDFPSRMTRYVKLEIQGRQSWCMLGEITVE